MRGKALFVKYLLLLFLLAGWRGSATAASGSYHFLVTVIPFSDTGNPSSGTSATNLLEGKLSGYKNISIVPSETLKETIYRMEPSYLSGERQSGTDKGSMLWDIDKDTVSRIILNVNADYAVRGKISHFGNRWAVDSYISRKNEEDAAAHFFKEGVGTKEMSEGLSEMAMMIANWIDGDNSTASAEDHMKEYLSGSINLGTAIIRTRNLVVRYPDSIPVRAILLELYLKEEDHFRQELITSARDMALLLSGNQDHAAVRYLMSVQIDPFDILAIRYEKNGDLNSAIKTRQQAIALLPFGMKRHRLLIGRDHFKIAKHSEAMGNKAEAAGHYREATHFLPDSSAEYMTATKKYKKMTNR